MNVVNVNIDSIQPYRHNTKTHTETQVQSVANSIREFGFIQPIVLDKDNTIVIGHCRYEAAKTLGMEAVPCLYVDELSEEQVKTLRIVDNKLNESEWDLEQLKAELNEVMNDLDMTTLGFNLIDILDAQNDYTPEDLWFDGLDAYSENAESQLKVKRVIINYKTKDEQMWIDKQTGVDGILKVVNYVGELMK